MSAMCTELAGPRGMPSLLLLLVGAIAATFAGCSRTQNPEAAATPLTPSPVGVLEPGGIVRRSLVAYPPRAEGIDFRAQLENKYVSMGRAPVESFVDQEGDAVWIGEYSRYRTNGCDHNTATQYVMLQIDSGVVPPACSATFFPENAIYPAREEVVDFRHQLGKKYQAMGRSARSAVDPEGAGIWMGEYYRYRTSGCDHATASQKTLTQVDGNPTPETCLAQCVYRVDSPASVTAIGGTFRAEPERTSGSCEWLAESEVPWISLARPVTGSSRSPLTYTVQPNTGAPRAGSIRISYPDGRISLQVNQGSPSHHLEFQFFDPARSTAAVTECQIRGTATICTLTAIATLPAAIVDYNWLVTYAYGGSRVREQSGPLSALSFTESCGVVPGTNVPIPINVTLTATDSLGNSATIYSGRGSQPALQLRAFACP
jgi:hypothetical protein